MFSRLVSVELVANERVETIVRGLARDFTSFGGLPLARPSSSRWPAGCSA
ncbi:MAG: hypothetical protein IT374_05725 [Polyangiaceae bacterium]|nr:hypothetical protein [Polyangiaceae bacterium]